MRRKGLALKELDQLAAGRGFSAGGDGRVERGRSAEQSRGTGARLPKLAQPAGCAHLHADEAASVWYVRESALGAVVFVPGEPDRWEGWEDAAVPPEKLGSLSAQHLER